MANKTKNRLFMGALLGFAALASSSAFVSAASAEAFYQPKIDFRYKLGNERTLGSTELFAPLVASKNEMLFLDMRAVVDDNGASEGNLGFGYRSVQCCSQFGEYIRGVYGFFDRRRSAHDNYFSQVTLGAEVLSESWDFRANIYMPFSNGKVVRQNPSTARLAGSGIFVDSGTVNEKALRGYDIEVGHRLFGDSRIYAGGYQFVGGDVANITGVRGRLEWDVSKHIKLGLESQHDHVRGNNSFAEVRLSIPFGPEPKEELKGIYKRMTTPVVRDIDVVTQERQTVDISTFAVQNTATGQAQEVFYVDNSGANGDGTTENPFNNLADAEAAAGAGDIIYVAYGDGTNTNMDAGITLANDGQKLIGSGVDFTFDTSNMNFSSAALPLQGDALTIATATTAPVMTNTAGDGITVGADNVEVAGLTLDNPSANGISITNFTGTQIHDLTITDGVYGVSALYSSAGNNYQLDIDNLTMSSQSWGGVYVNQLNNTGFIGTITNSTITNSSKGLRLTAANTTSSSLTVVSNILNNNVLGGIEIVTSGTAAQNNILITDNSLTSNNIVGIRSISSGASTLDIDILRNQVTASSSNVDYVQNDSAIITTNFIENTLTAAGTFGLSFNESDGAGDILAKVESNSVIGGVIAVGLIGTGGGTSENIDVGGGTQGSLGQNRIYGGSFVDVLLNTDAGIPVKMENNWWGVGTGLAPARSWSVSGLVDADPFLAVDPNP